MQVESKCANGKVMHEIESKCLAYLCAIPKPLPPYPAFCVCSAGRQGNILPRPAV